LSYNNIIFKFNLDCGSVFHIDIEEEQRYIKVRAGRLSSGLWYMKAIHPTSEECGLPCLNG
jgi:hypothetical protein